MKVLVIILGLLVLGNIECEGNSSVKITLFYETLCPYCIKFIVRQLYETAKTIPNYIKLDLVPYGKANREIVDGKWKFNCHHGPEECHGNSVHACVLEQWKAKSVPKLLDTLKCLMMSDYRNNEISECFTVGKFDYDRYSRCMINSQTNLTLRYAERTERNIPEVTFVPLIMINDYYNKTLKKRAYDNLLGTVCGLLDPTPDECKDNEHENYT